MTWLWLYLWSLTAFAAASNQQRAGRCSRGAQATAASSARATWGTGSAHLGLGRVSRRSESCASPVMRCTLRPWAVSKIYPLRRRLTIYRLFSLPLPHSPRGRLPCSLQSRARSRISLVPFSQFLRERKGMRAVWRELAAGKKVLKHVERSGSGVEKLEKADQGITATISIPMSFFPMSFFSSESETMQK